MYMKRGLDKIYTILAAVKCLWPVHAHTLFGLKSSFSGHYMEHNGGETLKTIA